MLTLSATLTQIADGKLLDSRGMRANLSAYRNTFSEQYAFRNTFHYFVLYIMNSSNTVNAEFSIFSKKHQIPPFIVFVKSVHYLSEIQNIKNIENKVFVRPSRCSSFSCASFSLRSRFFLAHSCMILYTFEHLCYLFHARNSTR